MELQSAKEDGYLPGLAFLDTARGIGPIVEKLPHALQEKWVSQGSRFKDKHNGLFPLFSFFAKFICYEAHIRNDPSFTLPSNSYPPIRDKSAYRAERIPIAVHKTDVASGTKRDSPGKSCPIHHKPHQLRKCREFRPKQLDERKAFLRENGICYKCCALTSHVAKDCQVSVKCTECGSNRHVSALHPGPAPQAPKTPVPEPERSEMEEELSSEAAITTHCTEICGEGQPAVSCAKICLARVFPQGQHDKAIKVYVVLDDQSNRSLARPEFLGCMTSKVVPLLIC